MLVERQRREFILAWGNVPGACKKKFTSAESAIHSGASSSIIDAMPEDLIPLHAFVESRFQRSFGAVVVILGRCPRLT
jgi:hypothetical protein